MSKVCIFLADGFEEIEGLTVVDLVRRAGIEIDTVSITGSETIVGAHSIELKADKLADTVDYSVYDMLVLPGGMPGTNHLKASSLVRDALTKAYASGRYVAAICAAPTVLSDLGLLKGKKACCYESMEGQLEADGAIVSRDEVVVTDKIITSRGLGTAIPFALSIIESLADKALADKISDSIMYKLS